MSGNWDDMLKELSTAQAAQAETDVVLAKALPAEADDKEGDEKIADSAATDGDSGKEADGDKDDGEEAFGKSFGVTLEDGTKVDAYDGTAMMKSLFAEGEKTKAVIGAAFDLVKSLQSTVAKQTDMIKSLQVDVQRLGKTGAGRKAVLNINDKPAGTGTAEPKPGISSGELMTKCFAAQKAGRITSADISRVEAYLNRGLAPPDEVLARIA